MLMPLNASRRRQPAVVLLFVSALVLAASLYAVVRTQLGASALGNARTAAEVYLSGLKDVETGYRGFVIVGSDSYLQPYDDALSRLPVIARALDTAVANAGVAAAPVERIQTAANALVDFAATVVAARRDDVEAGRELVRSGRGKLLMDEVRDRVDHVQGDWAGHLSKLQRSDLFWSVAAATLSALGLLAAGTLLVRDARKAQRTTSIARALVADVIEKAPLGLVLLDSRQCIAQHNSTFVRLFEVDGAAAPGRPLAEVSPLLFEHVRNEVARVTRARLATSAGMGERDADAEVLETVDSGRTRFYKTTVFPIAIADAEGADERGAGIIVVDVTIEHEREIELQDAKQVAEGANRAKSAFIANMSHELRTPLAAVLGYSEMIEDELRDRGEAELLADLSKIGVNARHLLSLINDVLDLSKIEAEKMEVNAVDCDLGKLIGDVMSAVGGLVANNRNELEVTLPEHAVPLHTDELKVKQILLNLLGNAAKFTKRGTVRLRASDEQQGAVRWVRLEVSDTGVGISEEKIDRLFKRFSQADEATTREYGGTGLGLALTRALATLIGGTISVRSVIGEGSTFTLLIPARYDAAMAATIAGAEAVRDDETKLGTGPLVLVVDDEPSAREFLTRQLQRAGFSVATASNGAGVLERVRRLRPAAVLLDVMMPGLDGWHVLRSLKTDPATAGIPVIMQTVLDDNGFARLMGASGYLQKPVARVPLAQMLADVVPEPGSRRAVVMSDASSDHDELAELLRADGWNVSMLGDPQAALAAMEAETPGLLIVDMTMAAGAGLLLVREVRQRPQWNGVPIVAITPVDIDAERMQRLKADAVAVVEDTVSMSDLVAELRRHQNAGPGAVATPIEAGDGASSPAASPEVVDNNPAPTTERAS